jgi:thiamine biosynthesis lipoprotein
MAETLAPRVFVPVDAGPALPAVPAPAWPLHRFAGESMGTRWSVQAYAPPSVAAGRLHAAIDRELAHAIALFSHWHAHSEVARFNAAPAGRWRFSPACWALVAESLAWAKASGSAVDPTLGALIDLWGFGPCGPRPAHAPLPTQGEIASAVLVSGWQRLRADAADRTLHKPAGLRLDLGGIAKGWAVDQVSARLKREGARAHLVEIGGEIRARGLKPDLQPWWVALDDGAGGPCSKVALLDMAVATSGDAQRHFVHGGRRYAHTIDGGSGWPVAHGVAAVSVLHARAAQADAHATVLTVMPPLQALAWAERHGLAALLTLRTDGGLQQHMSTAMAAMLEPTP